MKKRKNFALDFVSFDFNMISIFLLCRISVTFTSRERTYKSLKDGHFFKSSKFSKFVIILRDWGLSRSSDTQWHFVSAEDHFQHSASIAGRAIGSVRTPFTRSNEEVYRYPWRETGKASGSCPFHENQGTKQQSLWFLLSVGTARPF